MNVSRVGQLGPTRVGPRDRETERATTGSASTASVMREPVTGSYDVPDGSHGHYLVSHAANAPQSLSVFVQPAVF